MGFHSSAPRAYQVLDQSIPRCSVNTPGLVSGLLGSASTGWALAPVTAREVALVKPASLSKPPDARKAMLSLSGRLPMKSRASEGFAALAVCEARVLTSNSVVVGSGSLWMMRTVPPTEPEP